MSDPVSIPVEVDELDAAWFAAALDLDVTGATVIDRSSGTTGRAKVALEGGAGVPATAFVKLPPFNADQRSLVDRTGMGVAEARFYAELAAEVPVRVPTAWFAAVDGPRYVMVLEDLAARGCRFPSALDDDIEDRVTDIVEQLAVLHAAYWDSPRFAAGADLHWLDVRGVGSGGGKKYLKMALDNLGDELGPTFRGLCELYLDRGDEIATLWSGGVGTLVHGDSHIGNLYVDVADGGRTGFLDWAVVCRAAGMRDVAYVLCNSTPVDVRQRMERPLIERYCEGLAAAGVVVAPSEAWDQYRLFATYSWLSSATTAGVGGAWQTVDSSLRSARATTAACEELDSLPLLRSLLEG